MLNKAIVLDTNILISAAISPHRTSAQIVQKIIAGELTLVICPSVVAEYKEVFARPKFKKWLFPPGWFDFLIDHARILKCDPDVSNWDGPDSDDFVFLALAKIEGAVLVTGNLKDYPVHLRQNEVVLNPTDFLKTLL